VLAAIFIPKFADQVFKFTINNTTLQLLWLPVPPKIKQETKPVIDGTIKAFMEGFAGLSIFIAAKWLPIHLLSIAVLIIAFLWIFFAFKTKNGYVGALQKAIEKRHLNFENLEIDIADNAMVETIGNTLKTDEELKQLFALELINGIPLSPWSETLNHLFHTGRDRVRKEILSMSANEINVVSNEELLETLRDKKLADIAMNIVGKRRLISAIPVLENYLSDTDPQLQLCAAAALQLMESEKYSEAKSLIQEKMSSPDPVIQAIAIRLLADQRDILTTQLLIYFLNSPSEATSYAALFVAGERKDTDLISAIISNLADPKTLPSTRVILRKYPEVTVTKKLINILNEKLDNQPLCRGIMGVLKEYHSPGIVQSLIELLENTTIFQNEIIDTLLTLARKEKLSEDLIDRISKIVYRLSNDAYRLVEFSNEIRQIDKNHLLKEIIDHDLSKQIPFLVKLGIIHVPNTPVESYLQTIQKRHLKQMPLVLEVLDNIFNGDQKEWIMPLIEKYPTKELIKIGEKRFENLPLGLEKQLEIIIQSNRAWASAIAVDFILRHEFSQLIQKMDWNQVTETKYLKEVLIKDNVYQKYGKLFQKFNLDTKELNMYSTLEKTILLKTVSLFQTIPSEDLSKVAQIANEIQFPADNSLFKKGDFGDSLYIVMNGEVEIHKEERHIASLKQGACLGENGSVRSRTSIRRCHNQNRNHSPQNNPRRFL